jgi:hypothetical protein
MLKKIKNKKPNKILIRHQYKSNNNNNNNNNNNQIIKNKEKNKIQIINNKINPKKKPTRLRSLLINTKKLS